MITVPELTLEVREQLKSEHAHRFPELRYFPKPGDDGKDVKLPVVIGIPSGASKMPKGRKASRAWGDKVKEHYGGEKVGWDQLVTDCILWPPPNVIAEWKQRWPALIDSIKPALVRKYGGETDDVTEPTEDEPERIAAARAEVPGSVWLRFQPKGQTIDLVVKAPTSTQWDLFSDAMRKPDADDWALVLELSTAVTVYASMPIAEVIGRWPGLALQITRQASYLAGLAMRYEEGEL